MSDDDDYGDRKVLCARCGRLVPINDATPEEGDEWECLPCNRVYDKIEQLESKLSAALEEREAAGKLAHGLEADVTDLQCELNDMKSRLASAEDEIGTHARAYVTQFERALALQDKLDAALEQREEALAAGAELKVELSGVTGRLDSERLDRTREYNVVAEKLFAKENELLAASHRLDTLIKALDEDSMCAFSGPKYNCLEWWNSGGRRHSDNCPIAIAKQQTSAVEKHEHIGGICELHGSWLGPQDRCPKCAVE